MTADLIAQAASLCLKSHGTLFQILVILIGGIVIGLLGKFVAPGSRDNIPLWLTILCGIGGMLLGSLIYTGLFHGKCETNGVDVLRHLVQILTAAVLVMVAAAATGRTRR